MAWRLESLAVLSDFITTWWGTFNLSPHCTPTPHYGSITYLIYTKEQSEEFLLSSWLNNAIIQAMFSLLLFYIVLKSHCIDGSIIIPQIPHLK